MVITLPSSPKIEKNERAKFHKKIKTHTGGLKQEKSIESIEIIIQKMSALHKYRCLD